MSINRHRNTTEGSAFRSQIVSFSVSSLGENGESDTFITNAPNSNKSVLDKITGQYKAIPDGEGGEKLLRYRDYLKCGFSGDYEYRSVLFFYPQTQLEKEIGNAVYGIHQSQLWLTAKEISEGEFEAVLLSSDAEIDSTVDWFKPSGKNSDVWTLEGGDFSFEPLSTPTKGVWKGSNLVFDVSGYMTQWKKSSNQQLILMIKAASNASKVVQFHSWESQEALLGDSSQTTCRFLTSGDRNSLRTEGVRLKIEKNGNNTTITNIENRLSAAQQFYSFQFSAGLGATFTFFDPDTNNSINLGSSTCTVVGRSDQNNLVVSGLSLPAGVTTHQTTAEFMCETVIPSGSNVIEITNPSTQTKTEVMGLVSGEKISVQYTSRTSPNNSKSFTVLSVSDETSHNNRIRIFVREKVISENRNGLNTEIVDYKTKPELRMEVTLY
jgi:hypothetical protein